MNSKDHFTNPTLSDYELPKYEDVQLKSLDTKYLWVSALKYFQFFVLFSVILFTIYLANEEIDWRIFTILESILLILVIIGFILYYITFKNRGYVVRSHDVIFKSGVLEETTVIVPINRIQNIKTKQSLLEKWFHLSSLECYTSGGSSADLRLYGIQQDTIQSIQQFLQEKIQMEHSNFQYLTDAEE